MSDSLKHRVLSGLLWRGLERVGTQAISFVVSIVLARLLAPKDFGTITLITVFIALSQVFVSGGFGTALIQKKEIYEKDYNSVFYLSLSVAVTLYGVLFVCAPWIAGFYSEPILIWVLRLLSLGLIVGAFNSIQGAVLVREMKFKLSFKVSLISILVSGSVGIGMAYRGYGVWALVGSSLAGQAASTVALWFVVRWRPALMFSLGSVREMFRFSSKLLLSGLLDTFFNNLYNLIIGKLFNPTILGYYSRGQSIPNVVMSSVNGTISSVIFPALASCQHDKQRVKEIVRRAIKSTCFLVFPMMLGLAAVSKSLVLVLLTEKWLPCVPYLQLACITFAFWPLHVANLQAIQALGRSDIFLKLEIIKKALVIVNILITFRFGVMAMVMGQAVLSVVCVAINAWPNRRLLNYSFLQQVQDILPAFLLSAGMGAIVFALDWVIVNDYLLLGAQIIIGAAVYLAGAKVFGMESSEYLWRTGYQSLMPKIKRFA
jgi:O-antigen/teichoic acid export membrane protein